MPNQKPMSEMTETELIEERARLQNMHRGMIGAVHGNGVSGGQLTDFAEMEYSEVYRDGVQKSDKIIGIGSMFVFLFMAIPIFAILAAVLVFGK